ncbi:MAG: hypothetical protein WBC07_08550 [Methylotenera sp.]
MNNSTANIIISAEDKTKIAFDAVSGRLGNLSGSFNKLSGYLSGLTLAAGATYFVTATKNFADYADEIGKAAQKVGTTTEKLSALKYAGDLADASFEQVQTGLAKLAKNAEDFKDGSTSAIEAFAKIKIDPTTFKDSVDLFTAVSEKLSKMEDGSQKTAIAMALLGKSGKELIPLLNGGSAGLAEMAKEAKALGLTIDKDTAAAAERFNDGMTRLETASGGLARTIGQALLPSLLDTVEAMNKAIAKGNILEGVLRGIAGIGKIPFDLAIPEQTFTATGRIKELREEVKKLQSYADENNNGGVLYKFFGGAEKGAFDKQLQVAKNQLAAYEKFQNKLTNPKPVATQATNESVIQDALSFDELAKGISLTSVKLAEFQKKRDEAFSSFAAGKISEEQYNEIKKAIDKSTAALTQHHVAKQKIDNSDAQAAARFIENIQKQDALTDKSKSQILAYEAAHLKLNDAQKKVVTGIVADMTAKERAAEANKRWLEQSDLARQQVTDEVDAIETREQAYRDMADTLVRENEDLNVGLIQSDKERIKAQLDLEHARALARIEALGLESEQAQDLIDKETEHYQLKQKEIEQGLKKTKSISQELGATFKSAFEDAVVGGSKFGDMLQGLEQDIIRLAARKTILDPLLGAFDQLLESFSSNGGGDGGGNFITDFFSGLFKNAKGGVYNSPSLSQFSGGVYSSPQTFAFAKGAGVFAEAGPEAIMPLSRGADGKLGVKSSGTGGMNVVVNLIESPGNGGQVNQKQEGENLTLEIMVEKISGMMSRDISKGRGISGTLERQYGLSRAAGAM